MPRSSIIIVWLFLILPSCVPDLDIRIGDHKKYIYKTMENNLVVNIKSHKDISVKISFMLHNLTDDVTDMPIFKKELVVYPGKNIYIIKLSEIGAGKYSLRLLDEKNKLLDYRILEINTK